MLSGEATNTNFIVFDLTQQDQNAQSTTVTHANHFTNDMVCNQFVIRESSSRKSHVGISDDLGQMYDFKKSFNLVVLLLYIVFV